MSGQIVLVRHAETQWSQTGQHTSTTDLPLLDEGRGKAERSAPYDIRYEQFGLTADRVVACARLPEQAGPDQGLDHRQLAI